MEDNKKEFVEVEFETVEESDARMSGNTQPTKEEEGGFLSGAINLVSKAGNFVKEWGPTVGVVAISFWAGNKYGQSKERSKQQKLTSNNWTNNKKSYYYKKSND